MLQKPNRFWIGAGIILLLLFNPAHAGSLIQFEEQALIGFESDGKTYGYYGASNRRTGFSCVFLFQTFEPAKDSLINQKILSFYTASNFQQRNGAMDIAGSLYQDENDWVITLEDQVGGCDAAVGWNFRLRPHDKDVKVFKGTKKTPAIGLMLASKTTSFYKSRNGKFIPIKSVITQNDLFIVLKKSGNYSYGRYVSTEVSEVMDSPAVATGWIQSADLVNPFKSN